MNDQKKITNGVMVRTVFDYIRSLGYKITDVTHPDSYFLCDYGENSITHFRIKGHGMWKHWLFGLWVEEKYLDEDYVQKCINEHHMSEKDCKPIQLFAQYDTQLDKFKPSRSIGISYDIEYTKEFVENPDEFWAKCYIKNMLAMICKHPILCYCEFCGDYAGWHPSSFLGEFLDREWHYTWKNIKKNLAIAFWVPYTTIKCALARKSKVVDKLEFVSFEKENPGFTSNNLYTVRCTFVADADDDEICTWIDKWFKKNEYGHYSAFNCVVEVDSFRQIGYNGYFTFD